MMECLDIVVFFTDNSNKIFKIEPKITVKVFKEIVAQSIDLKDETYFGFCIKDERDINYWLSDNKILTAHDYFKGIFSNITLHFVVKYFFEIQNIVSNDVAKYYLYHQLKWYLYSGDIECDSDQCFVLLAMSLYIDEIIFEKFSEEAKKLNVIPLHLFTKHPSIEYCIERIEEEYIELVRKGDENLMEKFINIIFQLPTEITHYFLSKDFNSAPLVIGINKNGFIECNGNSKIFFKLTYTWAEIINITNNKSKISVNLQDSNYKSSIRRKSCANCASYEVVNAQLAKSIVYLARDTIDFISTYRDSPVSTLKSNQYKTERRNMSYIKKYNSSTISRRSDKVRTPVSNVFTSESSVEMSRSPSRMSLTSSNFNGSCLTNDSTSLQYDDDSLISNMSLQELKQKFTELCSKRNELQSILNQKLTEAIELSKEEFTMTCKVPSDHKLLDPLGEVCFTKNPLPSRLLNPENQSDYQSEKNRLLLQIETISNIYEVLRKTPKSEKKLKKELDDKIREINVIKDKLNVLEKERALEMGSIGNCRSNSMGNLNRISSGVSDSILTNGNTPNHDRSYIKYKPSYNVPLTEPSHRKFKASVVNQKLQDNTQNWNDTTHSRIKNGFDHSACTNTTSYTTLISNGNMPISDPVHINTTHFQRFASTRNIIKGPSSLEKIKDSAIRNEKLNPYVESNSSSISSVSRSSIDDAVTSDRSEMPDEWVTPHKENETSNAKFVSLRQNISVHGRDSIEVNHTRLDYNDKYSQKLLSKYNKQNRKSASLEDLREEESSVSITYLARRQQKELLEPLYCPIRNRVTYRPSIQDGRPINLTKGKQPSIIKKQARNNSFGETN